MHAILEATHDLTDTIRQYWFKPERPLRFTPGQFLELSIIHDDIDDRGHTRWFTICSTPEDDLFCITTKHASKNGSSFKRALHSLEVGGTVQVSEPLGDFVLPKDASRPVIFVAGGIGITPFIAIMQHLTHLKERRDIKLIHGVANESEIIFQDVFEDADVHATIIVENASAEWGGERGLVDANKILGLEQPTDESLIYLSGPEPMIQTLKSNLLKKGVGNDQIITDTFPGYTAL